MWPMLVNVHEQITNKMMPIYDESLVAKFKDVRPVDRQLELSEQTMYAQTHTINEVRSKWYSDDPVGDERGELFIEQLKAKKAELDSDVVEKSKSVLIAGELKAWKRFVDKHARRGKLFVDMREFTTKYVTDEKKCVILDALGKASNVDELRAAFEVTTNAD